MTIPQFIEKIGCRIPIVGDYIRAREFQDEWSRFVPPGHFYSPIPSQEEIERWSKSRTPDGKSCAGVDLRIEAQKDFAAALALNYPEIPFKAQAADNLRYYFDNGFFSYSDAIFLHLIIRHLKPRQIVEVGSGFSSAVMLDTVERFLKGDSKLTFIEPYPDRLLSLLRPDDAKRCTVIEKGVQDVALEVFTALESGDILFVDSSHVSKAGSDVNYLLFEVYPRLKPGVWIHIHDIFPGFEYPEDWLRAGRAWNESSLVRAFLLFNESFEIVLHGPFCIEQNRAWFQANMPDCLKNSGGSLWIRRKK
jgi:predicted O-methyltransferase YrrM